MSVSNRSTNPTMDLSNLKATLTITNYLYLQNIGGHFYFTQPQTNSFFFKLIMLYLITLSHLDTE